MGFRKYYEEVCVLFFTCYIATPPGLRGGGEVRKPGDKANMLHGSIEPVLVYIRSNIDIVLAGILTKPNSLAGPSGVQSVHVVL